MGRTRRARSTNEITTEPDLPDSGPGEPNLPMTGSREPDLPATGTREPDLTAAAQENQIYQ